MILLFLVYDHLEIHTYRRTDRQADRQTDRQTDTHTHTHTHTYIHRYIHTYIHAYTYTYWEGGIKDFSKREWTQEGEDHLKREGGVDTLCELCFFFWGGGRGLIYQRISLEFNQEIVNHQSE